MSDPLETATEPSSSVEPSSPSVPAAGKPQDDGIADLLQEYERSSSDKTDTAREVPAGRNKVGDSLAQPEPAAAPPRQPMSWLSPDESLKLAIEHDQMKMVLNHAMEQARHENMRQQEKVDYNEVLSVAKSRLDGMDHLPEDFAQRWLLSEYQVNQELRQAWDERYANEEMTAHARAVVKRALKRMEKEARSVPTPADLEATADRAAVAAAVRGASGKAPPAESEAAYHRRISRMSDQELRKHTSEEYGFTPSI